MSPEAIYQMIVTGVIGVLGGAGIVWQIHQANYEKRLRELSQRLGQAETEKRKESDRLEKIIGELAKPELGRIPFWVDLANKKDNPSSWRHSIRSSINQWKPI